MPSKAGNDRDGDRRSTRARPSLRGAWGRAVAPLVRESWGVARHLYGLPLAWRAMAVGMARDTRRHPHMALAHWNGVPFGMEIIAWAVGPGFGLLLWAGAALVAAEGAFALAFPERRTRVRLWLGEARRAEAERVAAGYSPWGRQGIPPSGHLEAGMCLAWLGRHAEALEAYARAGGAEPAGLLPLLRGLSLACLGRHAEARGEYAEAMLTSPCPGMARAALGVSRELPEGHAGDPDGLPLSICLDAGGAPCAQCGRPAGCRGHAALGEPAAAGGWRLCHMRGRGWNALHGAGRAGLLALPLAVLVLLPLDQGLAATAAFARMFWRHAFG